MSLLDLASLVLAPTATKEGKVYSAIPDTGDGDMTFSRGSAATRVNSAGLIEKERANLLLQSNTFDTTWVSIDVSLTSGQTGYDGSSDAWRLTKNASSLSRIQQNQSISGIKTVSVYAKAETSDSLRFRLGSNDYIVEFNLSDETSTNVGSVTAISHDVQSIGSGWYRCIATWNVSSASVVQIDNEFGTTSSNTILIQDAMLNEGLVAHSYIETTTTAVYEGITDDVPRVDYSGGKCPSLLLEGQRTNLFEYSEYFEGSYWGKTQQGSASVPVVTGNYAISPEGVQNATRVQFDAVGSTSSDRSGLVRDFAFTSGTTYSISCWVKATSGNNELVQFRVAGSQVGGEQTATDEWQLFTATHTATASVTDNFGMQVRGNNTTNESDILIYGMQLEQSASYASSYIPTYGTSTTRVQDSCSKTGISELIGQTEGTLFLEIEYSTLSGLNMFLSIRPNPSNKVEVYRDGGTIYGEVAASSSVSLNASKAVGTHKIAFAYKSGSSALYIDGVLVGQSTVAFTYSATLADLFINQRSGGTLVEAANYKQILLFKTRLTNDELADLTTL